MLFTIECVGRHGSDGCTVGRSERHGCPDSITCSIPTDFTTRFFTGSNILYLHSYVVRPNVLSI